MKRFEYADFLRYLQERGEGVPEFISAETSIHKLEMDSLETFELFLLIEEAYGISIPFQIVKEDMTINELVNEINRMIVNATDMEH